MADDDEAARDWQAAIDTRLVDACERHVRDANRRRPPTLPINLRTPRLHIEPADWRAGFVGVHEYDLPYQLFDDLKVLMPQALLRDLFRPEFRETWFARELIPGSDDRQGRRAWDEVRAAREWRPEPTHFEGSGRVMREVASGRRQLYETRWEGGRPDDDSVPTRGR